jgi:predicted transcriptional regulator
MARPATRHPTELELEILKVLWRTGPANVRQVCDALAPARELAYTSVMTMLGIMARKGYVSRKKVGAGYVYNARCSEKSTTQSMLWDLVHRVFSGSAATVMQRLLETTDLDAQELKQIRQLIHRKTKEQSP